MTVYRTADIKICEHSCPKPWTNVKCGGLKENIWYLDMYEHNIGKHFRSNAKAIPMKPKLLSKQNNDKDHMDMSLK